MAEPTPKVEVRRSRRRRQTVSAYVEDGRIVVLVPDNLSKSEERDWVRKMVARLQRREQRLRRSDDDLMRRAHELNDRYFGGLAEPASVKWVANQRSRWGSCTPGDRTIRLSERLQRMPDWVIDYVIVHELAHILEPGHNEAFWGWVGHYPHTQKAKGYLLGWSEAAKLEPPPGTDGSMAGDAD